MIVVMFAASKVKAVIFDPSVSVSSTIFIVPFKIDILHLYCRGMGAALSPHVDRRHYRSLRRFSAIANTRISAKRFNRVL